MRRYGAVNWIGLKTLLGREVYRFMKIPVQTVIGPIIQTALFLTVFALAWGNRPWAHSSIPFIDGLTAGLVMLAVMSNAFQNTSGSMVGAKVQGISVDFLMPPLSATELAIAFISGAAARGIVVGLASIVIAAPFARVIPHHWLAAGYFFVLGSVMFGAVGLIGGIWAEKFENIAAVTLFIVTPLTFLSGTFYSVEMLPPAFRAIGHYNPVYFVIDGFRYGMIGYSDKPVWESALVTGAITAGLCWGAWAMLKSGYRLKA
ncbi:MAG: ABC transporter permease [Hyphomonadaceae bacterium]|nr:ABC transporter permease [Hyphomonadaceae bacterium]